LHLQQADAYVKSCMIHRLCLFLSGLGLLSFSPALCAQTAEQIERMLEESSEQHMREELGVNPITAPTIRNLLNDLDQFRPVPIDVIAQNRRDLTFPHRLQTAMHFGSLVADGFMLTLAERQADIEDIGRALIRQANNLGVGDRLTRRSKSILERSSRGDWIGMRQELIDTQADVEEAMMQLRDEEIAHLVSFGGWLRGFQLATHATAANYFPNRAQALVNEEVLEYFQDRLSTLHPQMQSTELVTGITSKLEQLHNLVKETSGRPPTRVEVDQMRDLADGIFLLSVSPVNEEGRITGPPQIVRQP
jgi:hypothetical protein